MDRGQRAGNLLCRGCDGPGMQPDCADWLGQVEQNGVKKYRAAALEQLHRNLLLCTGQQQQSERGRGGLGLCS